jgi:glycosyltransferase involved in cell wall biosynthesis
MRRLVLVGPYPSPIGGVSVHVQRLHRLARSAGWDARVVGWGGRGGEADPGVVTHPIWIAPALLPLALRRVSRVPGLIHCHFSTLERVKRFLPAWHWSSRGRPYIVSIHGGRWKPASARRQPDLLQFLRRASAVVAVSQPIADAAVDVMGIARERVHVIPAHLAGAAEPLPPTLASGIDAILGGGRRLLVASGSATPLYGLHEVLEATAGEAREWGVLLATYGPSDPGYEAVLAGGMRPEVLRVHELPPGQFLAVLRSAHVLVRPTRSDGDAVAIREALDAGARVIATDCVPRPPGVEVYPPGQPDRLRARLHEARNAQRPVAPPPTGPNSWHALRELYEAAWSEASR